MTRTKGFTLVELLVTTSLLSMIILIGASAFGMFAQGWQKRLENFDATMRNAQNILLVQEVLGTLLPYITYSSTGKPLVYFEGNRNGFVAIASKSIYRDKAFTVVRFSVVQKADFTYDVLFEEALMQDGVLLSLDQVLTFSNPITLFESVTDPLFQYYGWPEANLRFDEYNGSISAKWLRSYDGLDALSAPLSISLNFTSSAGNYEIYSQIARAPKGLLSRYASKLSTTNVRAMNPDFSPAATPIPESDGARDDYCEC